MEESSKFLLEQQCECATTAFRFQAQEKKPTMEEAFTQFMTRTNAFIDDTKANFRNQGASIRNLEHQVGEISKLLAARTQGALPSNIEKNPREHANAISLRSGKELDPPKQVGQQVSTVVQPIQGATSDLKNQSNDSTSILNLFLHLVLFLFLKD